MKRKWSQIQQGKETKEAVLQKAIEILKPVILELKEKEAEIGKQLNEALRKATLEEKTVGACPKCADGKLVILRSKKQENALLDAQTILKANVTLTFPLPQSGLVKPLGAVCKSCGSPVV